MLQRSSTLKALGLTYSKKNWSSNVYLFKFALTERAVSLVIGEVPNDSEDVKDAFQEDFFYLKNPCMIHMDEETGSIQLGPFNRFSKQGLTKFKKDSIIAFSSPAAGITAHYFDLINVRETGDIEDVPYESKPEGERVLIN